MRQRLQSGTTLLQSEVGIAKWSTSVDTGRKLNVHKTFRRRLGRLLNVLCRFNLRPVSTRTYQNLEQYRSVNICLNSSFFYEGIWKEWGSAIDFAAQLLDLPLIYIEIENLPWEVLSSWTCVIITRKNHTHSAKLSVSLVSLRYNLSIGFHVLETVFI